MKLHSSLIKMIRKTQEHAKLHLRDAGSKIQTEKFYSIKDRVSSKKERWWGEEGGRESHGRGTL